MGVTTAYLNGIFDREIYFSSPEGVDIPEGHC
jgi:hypothetical protein